MNFKPEPMYHTQSYAGRNTHNKNNYEDETTSYKRNYVHDYVENKKYYKPCMLEIIIISSKTLTQPKQLLMLLSANTCSTKLPRTTKPIKQCVEKTKGCIAKEN